MEAYICIGCFTDNLKHDWLMMMSVGGAVVGFFHVTLKPSIRVMISNFGFIISF